ncbi:hypothetical protein [uncultured Limosilactobacillus sp.]|uniref:hypothetical protein n=1 Tax=uncultured Limosilactobacillus sp. TaxID=2837629 RepID=UPI002591E74F|nr:hypothetical protein [uncultured Limosilactobacillus sp.]
MANQGDGSRVPVDLTRWEHEEMDISGKFNARVGDTQDFVPMWVKSNGFPQDVRKWGLIYGGTDANMVPHRHKIECIGDLPIKRGDQPAVGKFTLPFDERTFNVPGKWNQFTIQFIDENGETVSTIDLGFDVFDNSFFAHMGDAENIYVEEFEKILQAVTQKGLDTQSKIQKVGDDFKSDMQTWMDKYKQTLLDAIKAVNDPKDGLYIRYQQLLDMTKQIQETLKAAQFHDRIFQYATVQDMKDAVEPLPGDLVVTQGWEARDDARGGFWRIRVKRDNETANGTTTIELGTGYIAERDFGIVQDMAPIHMGTVTYEAKADADGFVDLMPPVHMYVSKYGAGIAQVDVDMAGGSAVSEVKVQPIFNGGKCEIYISPADIRFRMPDINLETPSSTECEGPNVYVVMNIFTLTLSLKGAKATGFTLDKDFITEYKDLMVTL